MFVAFAYRHILHLCKYAHENFSLQFKNKFLLFDYNKEFSCVIENKYYGEKIWLQVREVLGSISGPIKSDAVSPTSHYTVAATFLQSCDFQALSLGEESCHWLHDSE